MRRVSASPATLATAVVLVAALVVIAWNPTRIGHDQAACLQAGDLLRGGAVLYVDVIDLNPPLIYYLYIIPAALARAVHAPLVVTFILMVWMLSAASALAARRMLAACAPRPHADLLAFSIAAMSLFVMARNDYGEREHLFVLAFLPYLALRFRRYNGADAGTAAAVAAGLCAGIATSLKPHFVVVALAPEIYAALRRRSLRALRTPEFIAFAVTGVAYAAHFALLPVPMRDAWFGRFLPLVVAGYRAYNAPFSWMVTGEAAEWVPPLAAALLVWFGARRLRAHEWGRWLSVAVVAGLFSFFIQQKGWPYHAIPAQAAMAALIAYLVAEIRAPARFPRQAVAWALAAVLTAETVTAAAFALQMRHAARLARMEQRLGLAHAIVAHSRPHEPVLVFATTAALGYPLLTQFDRAAGSRYLFSFPLAMLYEGVTAPPGRPFPYLLDDLWRRREEARFRADMAEDIRVRRPRLVLVATPEMCQACPAGFSLDEYLARWGFFDGAMRGYTIVERLGNATVWARDEPGAAAPTR
jgi:hypothetical protein